MFYFKSIGGSTSQLDILIIYWVRLKITLKKQFKMSSSKKFTCKGTLRQVFICLRPPPLLGFRLGLSSNFVGSESGQIQSVKLLQNMVSNTTQQPPPVPNHTLSVCVLWHREGEGGRWTREMIIKGKVCRWFRFAQLAKGKKSRP